MVKRLISILFFTLPLTVCGQKTKTVEAEYTYYASENVSIQEARHTALERAMLQAIIDAFGMVVSQSNSTKVENRNGKSTIDFTSIGGSDVKGEWIETIGKPKYTTIHEGDLFAVNCKVKGVIREIETTTIDFKAHILRNGIEERYEDSNFRAGDDLYLSFMSPISGFLAVYLVDEEEQSFCLLPYRNQATGIYAIEGNRHYVFFKKDIALADDYSVVDEYVMTCSQSTEHNQIYIIFSPNRFTKAVDEQSDRDTGQEGTNGLPRELSHYDFQKWLAKCRKRDKDMNVRILPIEITKR